MFLGKILSKILNGASVLTLSGVLLGSAFVTASWGMKPPPPEENLDKKKAPSKSLFKRIKPSKPEPKSKPSSGSTPPPAIITQKIIASKAELEKELERIRNPFMRQEHIHGSFSQFRAYRSLKISVPPGETWDELLFFKELFEFNPDITELALSRLPLGGDKRGDLRSEELVAALKNKPNPLKKLTINNGRVNDAGVQHLIPILSHPTLEELDLNNNEIGDTGAEVLGDIIDTNLTLVTLNLRKNKITGQGLLDLFNALTIRSPNNASPAFTLNMGENTLELKEMYHVIVLDDLSLENLHTLKPQDLALFCEDNTLYCQMCDKKKMRIMRTDKSEDGLDPTTYNNILSIITNPAVDLQLPFERIAPFEEELLQYTSLKGYTPIIDGFSKESRDKMIKSLATINVTVNFTDPPCPFVAVRNNDPN